MAVIQFTKFHLQKAFSKQILDRIKTSPTTIHSLENPFRFRLRRK
jgi:hypothetical protein